LDLVRLAGDLDRATRQAASLDEEEVRREADGLLGGGVSSGSTRMVAIVQPTQNVRPRTKKTSAATGSASAQ
jgi:hypothetical protein